LESRNCRLAKSMRWIARAVVLAAAGFFLTFLIGEALGAGLDLSSESITTEGLLLIVLVGIAVVGCALSWWRERLAGVVLVLVSIGFGVHIGVYARSNYLIVWLIAGLPYLIAGGLFFISRWLGRKAS
jgi:hypothetical protein